MTSLLDGGLNISDNRLAVPQIKKDTPEVATFLDAKANFTDSQFKYKTTDRATQQYRNIVLSLTNRLEGTPTQ